ncbi:unnamed protein product [Rhizoctonia solani]|nr:unnamed protein product [Rhizoctonia solani]
MEFEYPLPHMPYVMPISRSLDGVTRLESIPWRLVEQETRTPDQGPPFLTIYTHKPIQRHPKSESDVKSDHPVIRIPDLCYNYRMPVPLAPECRRKPRERVSTKTETRILAWLEDVEPVHHGPWVSFLPTCHESSSGSDLSLDSIRPVLIEEPKLEPRSFIPVFEDETQSVENSTDEMDTWPYDGRGLYEHHARHECGPACYFACQRRRKFRFGFGFGKALTRMWLPWTTAKPDSPVMMNSDVPHPPWWLLYRSNDDSLGSDEEDGDLELWLENATQKQLVNHELRFQLSLNQKPDSRIFSSGSEWSLNL